MIGESKSSMSVSPQKNLQTPPGQTLSDLPPNSQGPGWSLAHSRGSVNVYWMNKCTDTTQKPMKRIRLPFSQREYKMVEAHLQLVPGPLKQGSRENRGWEGLKRNCLFVGASPQGS